MSSFSGCRKEHPPLNECAYCAAERLAAELEEADKAYAITMTEYHGMQAERDRLVAERDELAQAAAIRESVLAPVEAERDRLDAECNRWKDDYLRLRAALANIAKGRVGDQVIFRPDLYAQAQLRGSR